MPPTAAYPPRSRPARRPRLATTLLVGVLATGVISTPAATGAWFTADKTVSSNSLTAATLQPVSGLKAVKSSTGVNVSWGSALQQPWATANSVNSEPTYTVTRTIDGANPTTIATGTSRTVTDAYAAPAKVTTTTFDAGTAIAGYVKTDGNVYMWGTSQRGALGSTYTTRISPQQVSIPSGSPIIGVSMMGESVVAVSSNGTLWGWGTAPQAGCTSAWTSTPTQISLPDGVKAADAAVAGECALIVVDTTGGLWERGGTVASGTFAKTGTAFQKIVLPGDRSVAQLTKAETVLASDGTVWSWGGSNSSGRYGDGTQVAKDTPTQAQIPGGAQIEAISTDQQNSVVARSGYNLYVWGANSDGQLGTGDTNTVLTPKRSPVNPYSPIVDVKTAGRTTTFVTRDGDVWTTGSNAGYRLGAGDLPDARQTNFSKAATISYAGRVIMSTGIPGQTYVTQSSYSSIYGWGAAGGDAGNLGSGGSYSNGDYTSSPRQVQTAVIKDPSDQRLCPAGSAFSGSSGLCQPNGTVTYSVTYPYLSWQSSAASANAG